MAVQPFTAFSSFIKIKIADVEIPFISSWSLNQARASSNIVYTISNSATAAGATQQQISWTVSIDIPISVLNEFAVDINDIAIGDGTQIIATLNRPSANNDALDFSGNTYTMSDLAPETGNFNAREGSVASQTFSFLVGKLSVSGGS
jgi:hypothetical protein